MKKLTGEKGITLIALIITIIVMLILVGVTINVALNGGLFDKAKDAAKDMEEQAMHEQIVMGMQLDGSKIDIEETYNEAVKALKGYTIEDVESGTNYRVINVVGKNGIYTYTITDEGVMMGNKKPSVPPTPEEPSTPQVDDDFIATTLMNLMTGQTTEDVAIPQLKEHMSITDENVTTMNDIGITFASDTQYAYVYEVDRLYKLDTSVGKVVYADEAQHPTEYAYGENIKKIKTDLENFYLGESRVATSEEELKTNVNTIKANLLAGCQNITGVDIVWSSNKLRLENITNGNDVAGLNANIYHDSRDNYGIYHKVEVSFN